MGTELQSKYQKLAHEYARVRAQVDVLKKGILTEKQQKAVLEEEVRMKEQILRKHTQENESLGFRNQQLSKRVQMLQAEIESGGRSKKKNKDSPPLAINASVQAEELAAKITENERLHTRIFEVTQRSEKQVSQLKEKISRLEQEVNNNDVLISELNRDHLTKLERIEEERIMLQVKLESVLNELSKAKEINMLHNEGNKVVFNSAGDQSSSSGERLLADEDSQEYSVYNISNTERSVGSKLDQALTAAVQMVERFFANLSTVFMYLEQRCVTYPIDTSNGLQLSPSNQKLCALFQNLSVHSDQILDIVRQHTNAQELSMTTNGDLLSNVGVALKNFAIYLETTASYIQLSIECENSESVCGPQLTEINNRLSVSFLTVSGILSTIVEYITYLHNGEGNPSNQVFILERILSSANDLHDAFNCLSEIFSSKVTMEYQLPFASQKLQIANECSVSAISSLASASQEIVDYFKIHGKTLQTTTSKTGGTSSRKNQNLSVAVRLKQHAVSYCDKLVKNSCDQVPYELAVHLSKQFVGNTEKGEALERQAQALKVKLSKAEKENSRLEIDYQKLSLKYEKAMATIQSSKVQQDVSQGSGSPKGGGVLVSPPAQHNNDTSNLGTLTSQDLLVEADEDVSTEMLIRQHSTAKLAELNTELHEAESKAAFLQSQCGVLTKQLESTSATRKNLTHELSLAQDNIQQLKDEVSTLSSNYESQLSTMSDHLCELNDTLMKREEELELLRKNAAGKKKWK